MSGLLSGCVQAQRAAALCLELAVSPLPHLAEARSTAVTCLSNVMKTATMKECAMILRDATTVELLSKLDRSHSAILVARRWRALLDESSTKRRRDLAQQVTQPEVEQLVDVLLGANDPRMVRKRARCNARGARWTLHALRPVV